jgi:pyruvate/2-oxoglutarate dehydrogenase complex dihydrolipoamide acyltransferase (E2) component
MSFWYFFSVPRLPAEVAHQSNRVDVKRYLASERTWVDVGSPIAVVENDWAVMILKANGKGFLKKTFFDGGASVKIGDPIAIIETDGEFIPHGREQVLLEIVQYKRTKPPESRSS